MTETLGMCVFKEAASIISVPKGCFHDHKFFLKKRELVSDNPQTKQNASSWPIKVNIVSCVWKNQIPNIAICSFNQIHLKYKWGVTGNASTSEAF